MRKAERLFQLTNLIRNKQPITANSIAQELGISVRSVYRYIDDLSVNGIPIYGTSGIGYQLDKNFELPPINLNENELEALLLGVSMVSSWTGNDFASSSKSLYNKIESVIPPKVRENFSTTMISPSFDDRDLERQHWEALRKAIKAHQTISIQYKALDEAITTRELYPLGLLYWGSKWTLASWCQLRKNFRSFRVDRITQLDVLPTQFELSQHISLKQFLSEINHNY